MSRDPKVIPYQVRARQIRLQNIEQCQFYLAYLANVGVEETNDMSVAEFKNMYQILLDQKQYEKEEHEKALKAAKSKR